MSSCLTCPVLRVPSLFPSKIRSKYFCPSSFFPNPAIARFRTQPSRLLLPVKSPANYLVRRRAEKRHNGSTTVTSLFTGIVEEVGRVQQLGPSLDGGFDMRIEAKVVLGGIKLGDSIAVNGTCLTVTDFDAADSHFTVGLAPETLRKTSLAELSSGSPVNLERAVLPDTRMGGHFVQGHVDGTGEIVSMLQEGDSLWVKIRTAPELLRLIVPKGFIAVDGTSLTVVGVYDEESCFDFMLVEYTQEKVVIPLKKVGNKVNLEADILGKYIDRLLNNGPYLSNSRRSTSST